MDKGIALFQYADDTILFVQDDVEQVRHLKLILYMFEAMSGLKINFLKSEVLMVIEDEEKCNFMLRCLIVKQDLGL